MLTHYVKIPVREVEWDVSDPAKPEAKETNHSFILIEEPIASLHTKLPIHWLLKRAGNDLNKIKELAEKIDKDEIQLFFGSMERIDTQPGVLAKIQGSSENAKKVKQILDALAGGGGGAAPGGGGRKS